MSLVDSVEKTIPIYKELVKGKFEQLFIDHLELEKNPPKGIIQHPKAQVLFSFTGQPTMVNLNANIHGGSSATAINLAIDIVLTANDTKHRTNVFTIESQLSYHRPLDIGIKYLILVEIEKASGRFFSARSTLLDQKGAVMVTSRTLKSFHEEKL